MSRCLNSIPISWDEPSLSPIYVSSLSYLCYLLETINIDETIIANGNEIFFSSTSLSHAKQDQLIKLYVSTICSTLLPSGMFNFILISIRKCYNHLYFI